ncbi:hypothetical protein BT69DRAFT_1296734 [Atractiella rhizophila]|nr:hypothetical protein BT69DRAFT_1296734 [Atractiella rhizophila]
MAHEISAGRYQLQRQSDRDKFISVYNTFLRPYQDNSGSRWVRPPTKVNYYETSYDIHNVYMALVWMLASIVDPPPLPENEPNLWILQMAVVLCFWIFRVNNTPKGKPVAVGFIGWTDGLHSWWSGTSAPPRLVFGHSAPAASKKGVKMAAEEYFQVRMDLGSSITQPVKSWEGRGRPPKGDDPRDQYRKGRTPSPFPKKRRDIFSTPHPDQLRTDSKNRGERKHELGILLNLHLPQDWDNEKKWLDHWRSLARNQEERSRIEQLMKSTNSFKARPKMHCAESCSYSILFEEHHKYSYGLAMNVEDVVHTFYDSKAGALLDRGCWDSVTALKRLIIDPCAACWQQKRWVERQQVERIDRDFSVTDAAYFSPQITANFRLDAHYEDPQWDEDVLQSHQGHQSLHDNSSRPSNFGASTSSRTLPSSSQLSGRYPSPATGRSGYDSGLYAPRPDPYLPDPTSSQSSSTRFFSAPGTRQPGHYQPRYNVPTTGSAPGPNYSSGKGEARYGSGRRSMYSEAPPSPSRANGYGGPSHGTAYSDDYDLGATSHSQDSRYYQGNPYKPGQSSRYHMDYYDPYPRKY